DRRGSRWTAMRGEGLEQERTPLAEGVQRLLGTLEFEVQMAQRTADVAAGQGIEVDLIRQLERLAQVLLRLRKLLLRRQHVAQGAQGGAAGQRIEVGLVRPLERLPQVLLRLRILPL